MGLGGIERGSISSKFINNCSKICLKSTQIGPGRALEGGLGVQLAAERVKSLRNTKTIVSGPPLAPCLGSHLRVQYDPEVVQKRF